MNRRKYFIITILITLLPLIAYVYKFRLNDFSKNPEDWSHFSTFCNISLSLGNLFVFIWLTTEIHKYNKQKDQESVKPIISFFKRANSKFYTLENIGLRAAIDLKIRKNIKDNKWQHEKQYYTLPPGEKIELEWTTESQQLGATYKDINDKKHYSYMEGNVLRYFDDNFGKEKYSEEYKKINYPMLSRFTIDEGGEEF
ncbi:hypothetical protein GS03_01063 [Flavobacterium sangjuense]|uniref:Uncharacterized protein n=2 Tax=Flavobacterium sangjuense TaxID=2518177 RepID=A0A4P7PRQ0_9FLAO|nr:hypothetical protein GS03_01063 [Flavobacterium sangjuense]